MIEVDCADLLSPDEMRFFWVGWYDNVIRFGKGLETEYDQIASLSEPLPDLKAVCLYGYEINVRYEVRNIPGENNSTVKSKFYTVHTNFDKAVVYLSYFS